MVDSGREGTLGCLLYWSPKSYNNLFLFFYLTTLNSKLSVLTFIHRGGNFCVSSLGYVHPSTGYCLIPLHPWREGMVTGGGLRKLQKVRDKERVWGGGCVFTYKVRN